MVQVHILFRITSDGDRGESESVVDVYASKEAADTAHTEAERKEAEARMIFEDHKETHPEDYSPSRESSYWVSTTYKVETHEVIA